MGTAIRQQVRRKGKRRRGKTGVGMGNGIVGHMVRRIGHKVRGRGLSIVQIRRYGRRGDIIVEVGLILGRVIAGICILNMLIVSVLVIGVLSLTGGKANVGCFVHHGSDGANKHVKPKFSLITLKGKVLYKHCC